MTTPHPVLRVLDRALDVLEDARVECAAMGGFAFRWWALPRPTYDVDFAVAMGRESVESLLRRFESAGFSVESCFLRGFVDRVGALEKVSVCAMEDRSAWSVDIFLAESPFVRSAVDRRVAVVLGGRSFFVVTPEDLLLFKLLAWRHKDRADVEDLLLVVGPLDQGYLADWASRLGVRDRLDQCLHESGRA